MINPDSALSHLMDLLAVEGLSGQETRVAQAVIAKLQAAGVQPDWIQFDQANRHIPGSFEVGNLIVKLPGNRPGPRLQFSSHLDTVPLCRGAKPVIKGKRIVPEGNTGLGADNRTAVAAMVTLVETLLKHNLPHPPLTLLFTVGEETGLWGARFVDAADLGNPVMGFNIDGGEPNHVTLGAIGAHRWEIFAHGKSSHAGVHPEHGISAALIAARGIANMAAGGWFGKIAKGKRGGTSNVGIVKGGEATNQVTDEVYLKGESRSHDPKFLETITENIQACFEKAAASVTNHKGKSGRIEMKVSRDYRAFRLSDTAPVVLRTVAAMKTLKLKPDLAITNGGLDANYLNEKGIPCVTLGAGQHNPHTTDEYADIAEYQKSCRLLLALATMEA